MILHTMLNATAATKYRIDGERYLVFKVE